MDVHVQTPSPAGGKKAAQGGNEMEMIIGLFFLTVIVRGWPSGRER